MNILILNASPKRKGGASRLFSKLLKSMLLGCKVTSCDIRGRADYGRALGLLENADAVVVSSPLYVDGIPAHMLPFLMEAERVCAKNQYKFKLYVMSNSGFVEGRQNRCHLRMYEAWCDRAGIGWGGGLGIGGGVMLHALYILFPILALISCAQIIMTVSSAGFIAAQDMLGCLWGVIVVAFMFAGAFACQIALAFAVRSRKKISNIYIRPLVPSFIFLAVADVFMLLSAIFKGTWPHRLFRKAGVSRPKS